MQTARPPGDPNKTVIAGRNQGYLGLAVNYTTVTDPGHPGVEFPAMVTAWTPTPDELAALNAGANVIVQLIGVPPINPMCVYVGDPPAD